MRRVLGTSLLEQTDPHQAALKNAMADAPITTTKSSIKMAGSSTTRTISTKASRSHEVTAARGSDQRAGS